MGIWRIQRFQVMILNQMSTMPMLTMMKGKHWCLITVSKQHGKKNFNILIIVTLLEGVKRWLLEQQAMGDL